MPEAGLSPTPNQPTAHSGDAQPKACELSRMIRTGDWGLRTELCSSSRQRATYMGKRKKGGKKDMHTLKLLIGGDKRSSLEVLYTRS